MSSTKGKVIKCKAAVAWEKNKPLVIEEIEVAPPKDKEIRVKIVATGLCHSDVSAWQANFNISKFPIVLGHEASGIVESIGKDITSIEEGDHVILYSMPECQSCDNCKTSESNICMKFIKRQVGKLFDGTTRLSCKGEELFHFLGMSTFAEYAVLDEGTFCKVNKKAPLDKICILGCGVPTGYGSSVNIAKVRAGSTCAVFGLGTIGLAAVMGCRVNGATRIIGIDTNNGKKEIAKKFGVTEFYNPSDYNESIHHILNEKVPGGCDNTFEAVGNVKVMESAMESCKTGTGKCVIIGVPPKGQKISIDPLLLIFGRVMTGGFLGDFKTSDLAGLVEDYLAKKIMLDEFITSTLTIDDVNKAFNMLTQGKAIRTVMSLT